MHTEQGTAEQGEHDSDQLTCTAGADGKWAGAKMEGTLRLAVAAKNNGQPLITPGFQMVANTLAPIPTTNTSR